MLNCTRGRLGLVGRHGRRLREKARCRDLRATKPEPPLHLHECDSRGDNEFVRDAGAVYLGRACSKPADRCEALRPEAEKPSRDRRRRLLVRDRDFRPTIGPRDRFELVRAW